MERAQWDEEQEVWMLQQLPKKVAKRPISTAQHRRPVTAYAQAAVALGDHNPRYKTDNILALALDMPDRTTADYSGSHMQTQVGTDIFCCSALLFGLFMSILFKLYIHLLLCSTYPDHVSHEVMLMDAHP